jgi:uncharacterized protein (DUF58 family)
MSTSRRDPEALLRHLEWSVVRRLDGLLHGDYRTLFRGMGLDFADLREYQFNDDVRRIDWNVTARLNQPHVRQYQEDREVAAWFVVDHSPSVGFGSGSRSKQDRVTEFVTVIARLLTRHGNAVGLLVHGGARTSVIAPRNGRRHLLHLTRVLDEPAQATAPRPRPGATHTDLSVPLRAAALSIRRRSLVFVVSDFIGPPGWGSDLARLALRHEVIALRVHDPLESRLPDLGPVTLRDLETGEHLNVDTHDAAFRRRFEAAALAREARVRGELDAAQVDTLELSTEEDLAAAVLRFADLRRARSRLAGTGTLPAHLAATKPQPEVR